MHRLRIVLKWGLYVVLSLPLCYGLWLSFRALVGDYFTIPTGSMLPTLQMGDKVFVNKLLMGARIYTDLHFDKDGGDLKAFRLCGLRDLERGDIVVFNFPEHNGKVSFVINNVYCKRVIALPGDSISAENGFYRNNNYSGTLGVDEVQRQFSQIPDSLLPREILNFYPYDEHIPWTTKNFGPLYVPRKGDIMRITPREGLLYRLQLEWELHADIACDWGNNVVTANGKPLLRHQFKHDYLFLAGDNVADSNDSRYWSFVPKDYVVGIVSHVIFSHDEEADTMRWNRTLKNVEQ